MFRKILIANRGEIACRIIRTAKKMGIATVAVFSEADRDAKHVEMADEAVLLGPAPSRESYLMADKVIAAAKSTGAEAIHPGYGFLSENEDFARRVEEEGLVFIGPKHFSIAAMGDKIASKKLAMEANVNTIPGWHEAITDPDEAVRIARDLGYPVMIKASAGGGGKGLRVAYTDKEAHEGFTSCRNEAKASFGDDRVFVEKFVESPRHIEIQVLGDAFGNVVYLNERECSIQRRHQKVIEEAPSPFLDEATRKAMGQQAVALAKAVNYQSAGTVEFVVGRDRSFFFLEMNTRLQVEHPVTECITGLDLVELMIRVAAGEPLPLTQDDVKRNGWAIECRINAEDPFRNFLPSTGRLVQYLPPPVTMEAAGPVPEDGGVRVDTGVDEGGEIPIHYDSMIAKLIVHGRDRAGAVARMREALNGFVIRGVSSNLPFQSALLTHPKFLDGDFNTGFIAEHYRDGFLRAREHEDPGFLVALAAFVRRKARQRAIGISGQLAGHLAKARADLVVIVLDREGDHQHHDVRIDDYDPVLEKADIVVNDRRYEIQSKTRLGETLGTGTCNGVPFTAQVERARSTAGGGGSAESPLTIRVAHNGAQIDALVMRPRAAELYKLMPRKEPPDLSRFLLSPMPGLLVDVAAGVGQQVRAGERLAVIEAMKMENVLTAAQDAIVSELLAKPGENLSVDQPILRFE
ncbi:MAG TPA: acetyl/propionyl/methylcrotonyl-CoA carboxylase subunit alpha [Fimbriimonadaceae bacterium]|nr:acetyl/propionyl/methylcrotonyl-CoA carboxylase subunit alpha [Fimbriimonadaceae bacterium]